MIVRIDPGAPSSPAEQLVAQIAASIEAGELGVGDRLPTIRALAADLGLAPGTVAKAYTELERGGWLHGLGRRGTVVAERRASQEEERVARAAEVLADAVATTRLGVADAHRALDLALARLQRGDAAG
jgi:DNA-binding transcriptional regulator YhcF (GntR family)